MSQKINLVKNSSLNLPIDIKDTLIKCFSKSQGWIDLKVNNHIYSVKIINEKIDKFIKTNVYQFSEPKNFTFEDKFTINNETFFIKLIHICKYRRCRIYLFTQHCSKSNQTRILAYGFDWIFHSAESFGSSLDIIDEKKLNETIDKINIEGPHKEFIKFIN